MVVDLGPLPAATGTARSDHRSGIQTMGLGPTPTHRVRCHSRRQCDDRDTPATQLGGLRPQPQPTLKLAQMRPRRVRWRGAPPPGTRREHTSTAPTARPACSGCTHLVWPTHSRTSTSSMRATLGVSSPPLTYQPGRGLCRTAPESTSRPGPARPGSRCPRAGRRTRG